MASVSIAVASGGAPETRGPYRSGPATSACTDALAVQVRLDREGFSPGEIDGRLGTNGRRALEAFQKARGLQVTGQPDCETWQALGGDSNGPALVAHTIREDDIKGPFVSIPIDVTGKAELPGLDYTSPVEELSERFHVAPTFLKRLNARARFVAGETIQVPDVTEFDIDTKPTLDAAAADIAIDVSSQDGAVRASQADGTVVFFAPVSSGSVHDPLPPGTWTVVSVGWRPVFHYNPALFWDAKPNDSRAILKPGPNNPVGIIWIGLNLDHYGLHGTPEPGRIGATESHGCVRLTNWDAARLAALVHPGTVVVFR